MLPDGLNATEFTQSPGPLRNPCGTGRRGAATSHSQTLLSRLPAASTCPAGPNAIDVTMSAGPVSGLPSDTGLAGSATDHRRTVLSALPAASSCPDGLNATDSTYPAGPCSVASSVGASGLATFHSRTVSSALPAASR